MLGSLRGMVTARLNQRILIEVQGVGYWVQTGGWQPSGEISCYLYHQVREDVSELYGFEQLEGLELFEKLLSISGIGPKAALALLSIGSITQIKRAILQKDAAFLSSASGVGSKAAQKIILELQGKIEASFSESGLVSEPEGDLLSALEGLGYKLVQIRPLLSQIPADLTSIDTQIKWALQQLSR